jgi:SAM-dependent methyltransferase
MRPTTPAHVVELLDAYAISAALGAAMEHGLFWLLADAPKDVPAIAEQLGVTESRCQNWLDLLRSFELLDRKEDGYETSASGKTLILDVYQPSTWAFLAREARFRFPAVLNLALSVKEPVSTWKSQGLKPPNYFETMRRDPDEARSFTRMLYEAHLPLAEGLARLLDMTGARELVDPGGGSGVVSLALLQRHPTLRSTVIDIEGVCVAGREIAEERGLDDRITYLALDYERDELPSGFDRVLFCDAGPYNVKLLGKLRRVLNPGGRLVLVDQFSPEPDVAPASLLHYAFLGALHNPHARGFPTAASVTSRLGEAGYENILECDVPSQGTMPWENDWHVIEARG